MRIRVLVREEETGIEVRPGVVYCNPVSHRPLPNTRLPMTITQGDRTWTIEDPDIAEAIYNLPVSFTAVRRAATEAIRKREVEAGVICKRCPHPQVDHNSVIIPWGCTQPNCPCDSYDGPRWDRQ